MSEVPPYPQIKRGDPFTGEWDRVQQPTVLYVPLTVLYVPF